MERSLPADINAERAVLGSCLLEPDAILAIGWLKPGAFYLQKHEHIFKSVLACVDQGIPPDMTTVYARLRQSGQLEQVGGIGYLGELAAGVPTAVYVEYYARIIEEAAVRRRIIQASGQIAALAYDEASSLESLIGQSDTLLEQAGRSSASDRYAPLPLESLLSRSFPEARFVIPGLVGEGLNVLGAPPKTKKSWLALSFSVAVACGGQALCAFPVEQGKVLHLCLEDRERRLKDRAELLLQQGILPKEQFFYQTDWPKLDEGGIARLERWMREHPDTRLIVVDTFKKIKPKSGRGSMYDEDYDGLEPLQIFANRHAVAVLAVHHFNQRAGEINDLLERFTGSSGFTGAFDNGLGIIHDRMTNEGMLFAIGRDFKQDREMAIRWDETTATWSYVGEHRDVKMSSERQAILDALDEGASLHYKELADIAGQKPGNCRQLCKRMVDEGLLQRNGPGIFRAAVNDQRSFDDSKSCDPVIACDPPRITSMHGIPMPKNGACDPVIQKSAPHDADGVQNPDHRITRGDLPHSNGQNVCDLPRITSDHRITNIDLISAFYGALDIGDLNQAGRLLIKLSADVDGATYRAARKALEKQRSESEHGLPR
jgi:DNA-binding Lrp family transcriptional regulator